MLRRNFLKAGAFLLITPWSKLYKDSLPRTAPHGMRMIPRDRIFNVADTPGVYHHSAGIVSTPEGLVSVYRTCNEHVAFWSNINVAYSEDGGKTWHGHKVISESSSEGTGGVWIAPQTNRLADGRIAVLADFGVQRKPSEWYMLAKWQQPPLGMRNHLFLSDDNGRTWKSHQVDDVGGEPSYVISLSDGTLMYTRTDSGLTNAKKYPPMPWGNTYYRSTAVFSDDGGRTFPRTVPVFDDPLVGDCEVGIVEYAPGRILAMSRVGEANGSMGHSTRMTYSRDYGKTWSKPTLAPIYAQRPSLGKLADGRLLVTFRQPGTSRPGTYAWVFEAERDYGFEPSAHILQEENCRLEKGILTLDSGDGTEEAVQFSAYPLEDDDSAVTVEAILAVDEAGQNGCNICAGTWVRFLPNRVCLADRPEDGFDIDATQFRTYRISYEKNRLQIFVDETLKLDVPLHRDGEDIRAWQENSKSGILDRHVAFGNRKGEYGVPKEAIEAYYNSITHQQKPGGYFLNRAKSRWKDVHIQVKNRRDHSIDWRWEAQSGQYPDQFRRDHVILVEQNKGGGNNGYSSWCQMPDGTVVIADYTTTPEDLDFPILRAYRLDEGMV